MTDTLQRAIDYLGAVEVAPGKYATHDRSGWWVAHEDSVRRVYDSGFDRQRWLVVYAHPMPSWWSPEQRFQVRYGDGNLPYEPQSDYAYLTLAELAEIGLARITADLETGAEVPA